MTYKAILPDPTEWDGKNKICSECTEELSINDYDDICNICHNKEEEEEEETHN